MTASFTFSRTRQIEHFWEFNEPLSTQNVNVVRFAHNVKWYFFLLFSNTVRLVVICICDYFSSYVFQFFLGKVVLWLRILLAILVIYELRMHTSIRKRRYKKIDRKWSLSLRSGVGLEFRCFNGWAATKWHQFTS